jgi:hypothetical protein
LRLLQTRAKVGTWRRAALAWRNTGDEDLARKTTGKPRNPKSAATALPEDVITPEGTDHIEQSNVAPDAPLNEDRSAETQKADATGQQSDTDANSQTAFVPDAEHNHPGGIEMAEVVSETPPPVSEAPAFGAPDPETPDPDPALAEARAAPEAAKPQTTHDQDPPPAPKTSIVPMLLGGAVAAALGYGAHMLTQSGPTIDTSAFQTELTSLRADLQGLAIPAPFDPAPLQSQIAALAASVAVLENAAPLIDPAAMSALGAQVEAVVAGTTALTTEMAALRADMGALQADMADLRDLAQNRVALAEAAVDTALARAGLDMVRAAIDIGAPFDQAVAQIAQAGVAVPDAIIAVATAGIVTPDALIESFDAHARAALRVILTDAPAASTTERLGNFLRAQVGARSTAPRDGDDPDAVLSRAGAAVQAGDFATALQELDALPEAGRAAMGDWMQAATARAAALSALPDLTQAIAP